MAFSILNPAVLQGSVLVILCIFSVIKGENCRTGNKLLQGLHWLSSDHFKVAHCDELTTSINYQEMQGETGIGEAKCRGEDHGLREACHKAKFFFRGNGHKRIQPPPVPITAVVSQCRPRDPTVNPGGISQVQMYIYNLYLKTISPSPFYGWTVFLIFSMRVGTVFLLVIWEHHPCSPSLVSDTGFLQEIGV